MSFLRRLEVEDAVDTQVEDAALAGDTSRLLPPNLAATYGAVAEELDAIPAGPLAAVAGGVGV